MNNFRGLAGIIITSVSLVVAGVATAADDAATATAFEIAAGSLSLEAPTGFQRVRPSSGMVETEFVIPSPGDLPPGRMTVMGAGGSIEANIDRWCGQFVQPDGGETKARLARKELRVAGSKVTIVDIPGTYLDKPGGPFAGGATVKRPEYRMLAAIVETPAAGNYFLKFYGPVATLEQHAAGFRTMIEGMVPAATSP
ncbi:MAG: hypothetical protein FJ284_03355 [Planctomycetes bacterium]|nr:hypothetical protein [Planctomycetota bacterium]